MSERKRFNNKRRIVVPRPAQNYLNDLAGSVRYIGSPYHKRNSGDFGLTPPSQPRPDKTLCDEAGIFKVADAQRMLEEGVRRGMISDFSQDKFPKHIWAVTNRGVVLEANYNNEGPGNYHGYPLFDPDPFRKLALKHWEQQ